MYTWMYSVMYPDSHSIEFFLALRNTLGAIFFLYFIFYFVMPHLFMKGRIIAGMLGLLLPFIVWNFINYGICSFIARNFAIHNQEILLPVHRLMQGNLMDALSIRRALQLSPGTLMVIAPSMSVKLLLNTFRAYTRTLRLERDNLRLEIDFLKSQLNPHFLFNTLNNIYALSIKNDSLAADFILNLSNMMRYTLYESNIEKVFLSKEVNFLKNYVTLESIRYGKNATITFECDDEKITDQRVAPLLMFPFIENAFKHCQSATIKNCWINISLKLEDNRLLFASVNSKEPGYYNKKEIGGIGIENSRRRLAILYPEKHHLKIEDKHDYYKIEMCLILN
ncbi:sensor histidine kinase [Chitinophaga niastensis]|nr:sensor histidine kinase [Chitinophaga niastensis]